MSENIEIRIVIDPSLITYFTEGIRANRLDVATGEEITEFLTLVLNDTMYPIAARKTGEQELRLSYQPRAFADPIF